MVHTSGLTRCESVWQLVPYATEISALPVKCEPPRPTSATYDSTSLQSLHSCPSLCSPSPHTSPCQPEQVPLPNGASLSRTCLPLPTLQRRRKCLPLLRCSTLPDLSHPETPLAATASPPQRTRKAAETLTLTLELRLRDKARARPPLRRRLRLWLLRSRLVESLVPCPARGECRRERTLCPSRRPCRRVTRRKRTPGD
jgi:hypothetical protein